MRPALLCLLLAALSWPALARQDQSQTPPAQSPTTETAPATTPPPPTQSRTTATPPATNPPPPSQAPAQASTPAGAQQAPKTEAPPASAKTAKKQAAKKRKTSKKKRVAKHKKPAPKKPAESAADSGPKRIVVRQITFYMQQSRSANQEGDLGRARNLAVKASQLCDALARQ